MSKQTRTAFIVIRVLEAEKKKLVSTAKKAGHTLSELIRGMIIK